MSNRIMISTPRPRAWQAGLLALAVTCCASPDEARAEADEQVYALIDARRDALFGRAAGFNIDAPEESLRQRILLGKIDGIESLALVQCLEIAAENSRDYQARKETLYRSALDLTLERWRFTVNWSLDGGAGLDGVGDEATTAEVDGDLGMSRLLGSGANILGSIGTSLLRAVNTGDGWDAVTSVSLSITQPLLRGAARSIVLEPLTQAERDLVYSVRDFERFRRTFSLDVLSSYYGILLTMDRVQNEEANLARVRFAREENEARYNEGRLLIIEVDQARQDELNSENRLIDLYADLGRQLDNFKILLGLPVDTLLSLDSTELEALKTLDGQDVAGLDPDAIVALGLEQRLDLLNTRDSVVDAARRVLIAEDSLRMGVDLDASVSASSNDGQPLTFRSEDVPWSIGLAVDLPIDNLPERNIYRRSLIDLENAKRSAEQEIDRVTADLLDILREARSAREGYAIQIMSVELSERRLESVEMSREIGRTDTRTLLESQRALLSAQNAASSALVDMQLARLRLYRDLELLELTSEGILVDAAALPRMPVEESGDDASSEVTEADE